MDEDEPRYNSISPLLKRLWPSPAKQNVTADEIAEAVSYIFKDKLSPVQAGALLTCLHFTEWDIRPDVLARCAAAMRAAAFPTDKKELDHIVRSRGRSEGGYEGGFVG